MPSLFIMVQASIGLLWVAVSVWYGSHENVDRSMHRLYWASCGVVLYCMLAFFIVHMYATVYLDPR